MRNPWTEVVLTMLAVHPTNDESMPTDRKTMTMLGMSSDWAGAIALYDQATAAGLADSQLYAIEGGDH